MTLIIYYYSQIVKNVFSHEKALRSQAKKMNVESLRSNQKGAGNSTAEVRIAKAAITICFLFVAGMYQAREREKSEKNHNKIEKNRICCIVVFF